jgi:hypothetical protein
MVTPLQLYIEAAINLYLQEDFDASTAPARRPSGGGGQGGGNDGRGFSFDQLRSLGDLNSVLEYVNKTLGRAVLGEGQGRIVYRLGNGKVLKVAKNEGGVGQNQAEASVCASSADVVSLFPKVFEHSQAWFWLLTEEAQEMTEEAFRSLTGLPWKMFWSALKGAFSGKASNVTQQDQQNYAQASANQFFARVVKAIRDCKYEPGDIAKLDSWGIVNGKPVIIDSGFTEAVNKSYYNKG